GAGNEGDITSQTAIAQIIATDTFFYVGGNTTSNTTLPGRTSGAQQTNNGGYDMFITRIPLTGGAGTARTTFAGGSANDYMGGLAYDSRADKLLIFGSTQSADFPTQDTTPASSWYDASFG